MAIASIKHKGLKQLFQNGNRKGVPAEFADKLQRMLTALHFARSIDEIDLGLEAAPAEGRPERLLESHRHPQSPARIPFCGRRRSRSRLGGLSLMRHGAAMVLTMKNPSHPGAIIREDVIEPLGLTVTDAARALGV